MNAEQILLEVRENASEWLEMSDHPEMLVSGILANKIVSLNNYIEYLEERLKHVSRT